MAMHGGWACLPATGPSRAARGRRTAETRRPPGGARRRRQRRRGRDDEIDVVDRKVEDEPVNIYRPGPFSPGL